MTDCYLLCKTYNILFTLLEINEFMRWYYLSYTTHNDDDCFSLMMNNKYSYRRMTICHFNLLFSYLWLYFALQTNEQSMEWKMEWNINYNQIELICNQVSYYLLNLIIIKDLFRSQIQTNFWYKWQCISVRLM